MEYNLPSGCVLTVTEPAVNRDTLRTDPWRRAYVDRLCALVVKHTEIVLEGPVDVWNTRAPNVYIMECGERQWVVRWKMPATMSGWAVSGWYYGYPKCCVEFFQGRVGRIMGGKKLPADHTSPEDWFVGTGFFPCDTHRNDKDTILQLITTNRVAPTPFPVAGPAIDADFAILELSCPIAN